MTDEFLNVKVFWSTVIGKDPLEGKATAVSSKNHLGDFDVLPGHINFISLISETITLHFPNEDVTYRFERGLLEVSENKVKIFLGI